MARFDYKFDYQTGSGTFGKITAVTTVTPTGLSVSNVYAAIKITAPDGTVVKDVDAGFGISTPTVAPSVYDLSNVYASPQTWSGINIPTDSTGAYMKGIYTITTYLKYVATGSGAITMSTDTITYNFCPVTDASSTYAAKLVRTLNCAAGTLKLDDLTNYTTWTVSSHVITITPPAVTLLPSVTTSTNSLQTNITYTNVSYAYGMSANGTKSTTAIPTVVYDSSYRVTELVTWNTATSVFVACANLCSVSSCAKKALSELEAKRSASGRLSEADMFTHDKIVDRLVLIQTDMICGGQNIDQYIAELQTIIQGVCNCSSSTTPTPFVNSMTV